MPHISSPFVSFLGKKKIEKRLPRPGFEHTTSRFEGKGAYHYTMNPLIYWTFLDYLYKYDDNIVKQIDRDYDFSIILYKFLSFEAI